MKIPPSQPQPPQKGEKKESIAKKMGFSRVVSSPADQETQKRAKKSTKEAKPVMQKEQKALEQRAAEAPTLESLPPEVLNYMMNEFGDIASFLQLSATSHDFLKKLSTNVDLKKLAELNNNNQLSFKDKIAYRVFEFFASSDAAPNIEELKKFSSINPEISLKDVSPEKLAEINANYNEIRSSINNLLGELGKTISPGATINDIKELIQEAAPFALIGLLSLAAGATYGIESRYAPYMMSALPYVAAFGIGGLGVSNYFSQFTLFRTATTNTLTSLQKQIKT